MLRIAAKAFLIAVGLAFGASAQASITYNFQGTFSLASPALASLNGTAFSGSLTYDASTPLLYSLPSGFSEYQALTAVSIDFADAHVSLSPGVAGRFDVVDGTQDFFQLYALPGGIQTQLNSTSSIGSATFFEFLFVDNSGSALTSTALPGQIDFAQYTPGLSRFYVEVGGPDLSLRGEITSLVPAAVPEPQTWSMMLIGFGAVGIAFRRTKKRTDWAAIQSA